MSRINVRGCSLVLSFIFPVVSNAAVFVKACQRYSVSVPCASNAIEFGVEGNFMKGSSGTNWIYQQTFSQPLRTAMHELQNFEPDHSFGWRIEGGYHYGAGKDLRLLWTHYFHTDRINSPYGTELRPLTITTQYIHAIPFNDYRASNTSQFDTVHLELGQLAHVGPQYRTRLHFGLQWLSLDDIIRNDVKVQSHNSQYLMTDTVYYENVSQFDGVGVRGGLGTAYDLGQGWNIEGNMAVGLLAGKLKPHTSLYIPAYFLEDPDQILGASFHWKGSQSAIVPEVDLQADLRYTTSISGGTVSINLGWRFMNYFNAVQNNMEVNATNEFPVALGVGIDTEVRSPKNNFAINGPVLGIRWVG